MFNFKNKYVSKRPRGSGAGGYTTAAIDWTLGPSRVWFKSGVTESEKREWASASRKSLVFEHADGSWTVQDYPPSAPLPAIWIGEKRMFEIAARVEHSEWLSMPQAPAQPAPSSQPPQVVQIYARFEVSAGEVRAFSIWDGKAWKAVK